LPLHGVEVIIEAARLLQTKTDIRFKLIGEGKKLNRFKKLVVEKKIKNVEFHPFVPINYLPGEIAKATICLCGPFGKSKKASRVITGKTFQCLAMAKPIIVGDTNANRELLRPNLDAIFCKLNSPEDLAKAIEILIGDSNLRQRISMNGFSTFNNKANIATIQKQMITIINSMNI
jgi:glycosyltransferase involved in cell wall biosynthesis